MKNILEAYVMMRDNYRKINGEDSRPEKGQTMVGCFKNCTIVLEVTDDVGGMDIKQYMGKSMKYPKVQIAKFIPESPEPINEEINNDGLAE